jgi:hypothetical protein
MKKWPSKNEPASFSNIVEPLRKILKQFNVESPEPRTIRYSGYELGYKESITSTQPDKRLTLESLQYELEDQDRDVLTVILSIAVQLGIEQGRRLMMEDLPQITYIQPSHIRKGHVEVRLNLKELAKDKSW